MVELNDDLAKQRCVNHPFREAVARCPECRRYFCRECVTEHDGRVICASCLLLQVKSNQPQRRAMTPIVRVLQVSIAFLVLWLFFYYAGHALLLLPDSFHEGTMWSDD